MLLFANVDLRGLTTLITALGSLSAGVLVLMIAFIAAMIISNRKGIPKRSLPAADGMVFALSFMSFNIIPIFIVAFTSEEMQGYFDQVCWYYSAIILFISLLMAFLFRKGRIARNTANIKQDSVREAETLTCTSPYSSKTIQ